MRKFLDATALVLFVLIFSQNVRADSDPLPAFYNYFSFSYGSEDEIRKAAQRLISQYSAYADPQTLRKQGWSHYDREYKERQNKLISDIKQFAGNLNEGMGERIQIDQQQQRALFILTEEFERTLRANAQTKADISHYENKMGHVWGFMGLAVLINGFYATHMSMTVAHAAEFFGIAAAAAVSGAATLYFSEKWAPSVRKAVLRLNAAESAAFNTLTDVRSRWCASILAAANGD